MEKLVHAVFTDVPKAKQGFESLLNAGYEKESISVLFSDETRNQRGENAIALIEEEKRMSSGATWGGVLGGILVGCTVVGTLTAAGPVAALLSGLSAGGMYGSLAGLLASHGMKNPDAVATSNEVKKGGIIMIVHAEESKEQGIQKVLTDAGGHFVHST